MDTTERLQWRTSLPVEKPYELIVCGAGPAGCAAALAARRAGLTVLLVEGQAQLGGMGTSGHVSHWLGGRTHDCKHWVVGGIFRELSEEAAARGFALIPGLDGRKYQPHGWYRGLAHGISFDPFAMAGYLDEKMADAGVDVLMMTQVVDVRVEAGRITHVIVSNKSGLSAAAAAAVVDATGDADVAARSGCEVLKGRDEDGLMAPATLELHVDGVDQDALDRYIHERDCPRFRDDIRRLREAGEWPFPCEIFICVQLDQPGTMMINTPRICDVDGTDGHSVTDGIVRGRAEALALFQTMRRHFPGFAHARLKSVAPLLGVRETRRIVGDYALTVEDVRVGAELADTIGFSSYGWDLPDPKRPSYQPLHDKRVPKPPVTPIPYRIMTPQPVSNLICPGRAVSVERDVLGPLRVMAPCMAMGQAAGADARQVVRERAAFRDVNVAALRRDLRDAGAIVDWPA